MSPSGSPRILLVPAAPFDTRASITFMLIGAIFASLLVPMFILLIFFSTRESRSRCLFYLNSSTLVFGIVQGLMLTALYARALVDPHANLSGLSLAVNIVFLFSPLFVESILLLRLVAVFPSRTHGRRTLYMVLAFPIAIRIGRLVNMCIAIARLSAASHRLLNNTTQWWALLPYVRAEWFLALVDNTYVSLVFLYRIRQSTPSISHPKSNAMTARVRRLFFIAVSNFLIPGLLNFIQLMFVFAAPSHRDSKARQAHLFFICAYIMIVFNYICIVGVVFATIWSTGTNWQTGWASMSEASARGYSSAASTPRQSTFSARTGPERASVDAQAAPLMGKQPPPVQPPQTEGEKA